MLAAYSGNQEALDLLLARGAEVDAADYGGNTPLMGVAFKGHREIASRLLDAGAVLGRKNEAGMDAYDFAMTFGRKELLRLFEERGIPFRRPQRFRFFWKMFMDRRRQKKSTNT